MKKDTVDQSLHNKNIFSLDRLGSSSSLEGGKSLTYGLDYKNLLKQIKNSTFQ